MRCFLSGECPQCRDHFPLLNLKSLNRREQLLFKQRLKLDVIKIGEKFSYLCNRTVSWLIDMKKSAKDLSDCMKVCCIDQDLIHQVRDSKEEDEDKGIKVAFHILKDSNYFSFFHYKLLEVIINTMATSSDADMKEQLQDYKINLECFFQRKIFHVPISAIMKSTFSNDLCLVVKTHNHNQQYLSRHDDTFEALTSLQTDIAEILQMNAIDLPLAGVLKGCLEIIFHVPPEILEHGVVFPLKIQQKEALYNIGIERICLGQQCYLLTPIIDQFSLLEAKTIQYLQYISCEVTFLLVFILDVNQMKSSIGIPVTNALESATSVEDTFSALSARSMTSFLHFQLLKRIISSLCSTSKLLMQGLDEYETTFKNECIWDESFSTQEVFEVPNAVTFEDAEELTIVTNGSWDENVTFEKIRELEGIVANILWCPQFAFSLHKIKPDPLTLLYAFSASNVLKTFPLTGIQWKQLKVNRIAELHCSEFDYQEGKSGEFLLPIYA